MTYFESILKVLVVGLVLGAGLPAVFAGRAGGLLQRSRAAPRPTAPAIAPNPALKYLGMRCSRSSRWVIITAVLWITRATIVHHFGFDPVPVHAQEVSGDHMTDTNTSPGVMDNILGWLHRGYPEGVPQKDYFALLALLKRSPHRGRGHQGRAVGTQVDGVRHGDRSTRFAPRCSR